MCKTDAVDVIYPIGIDNTDTRRINILPLEIENKNKYGKYVAAGKKRNTASNTEMYHFYEHRTELKYTLVQILLQIKQSVITHRISVHFKTITDVAFLAMCTTDAI